LEDLAEAQYRSRLLYYALCAMEGDHSVTPDDAIVHVESLMWKPPSAPDRFCSPAPSTLLGALC
jgi:hypothetical protein